MNIIVRDSLEEDIEAQLAIFNQVVEEGGSFPFENKFEKDQLKGLMAHEKYAASAVDKDTGKVVGLYFLGENFPGRCSTIANATYLVDEDYRGCGIGKMLVSDSLKKAKELGYRIMQFNGVVDSNIWARKLYKDIGFIEVGTIPKGFRVKDGHYEDMHIMYYLLER